MPGYSIPKMTVKICRVCFEEGDDLQSLGSGSNSYGHKLASCVPEIDVYIVSNPSICTSCLPKVEIAYALRETCIENERQFKTKKSNVIREKYEIQTTTKNPVEVSSKIRNSEVISEAAIMGRVNEAVDKNQIHVSVVFNNCFNENRVPPVTIKEEIANDEDFGSPKSFCIANLDEEKNTGDLYEVNKSEDELIKSLNEMCVGLKNFEEVPCTKDAEAGDQMFSSDESEGNFELDLNSLDLFNENEANESQRRCMDVDLNEASKMVSCQICKEMHEKDYINAHLETHNIRSTYECGRCGKTFSDTCELESHNLTHLKNLCDICGNVLKSKGDLIKHKQTHVTVCCGEEFSTGSLLQLHAYQKHGKTCGICKKTYNGFNELFVHLLEHMGKDKRKTTFSSDALKRKHQCESHHGSIAKKTELKKFQCKHCHMQFRKRKTYFLHLRHHRVEDQFICDLCSASFALKSKLEKHRSEEHGPQTVEVKSEVNMPINCEASSFSHEQSTDTDWEMCQLCPSKFQNPSILMQHVLKNHLVKTLSIELVDCQKSISDSNPIRLHCYACEEMYMNVNLYLKHMKLFHSKCTICNIRLNDVRNVIEHVMRHYKKNPSPEKGNQVLHLSVKNEMPYCELCQKEFPNKPSYNFHMKKFHEKGLRYSTKLYRCKICYDVFDTKQEMREHAQEHFVCFHCKQLFLLKSSLQRHIKFYHASSTALNQQQRAHHHRLTSKTSRKQTSTFHRKCKTCGEVFVNTKYLVKHIYAVHSRCTIECDMGSGSDEENVMMPPLNASRCDICQEEFDTVDKLKAHVSVHI